MAKRQSSRKSVRKMPRFSPPPAELVKRFEEATRQFKDAEHRKMFGFPAVFAGGNMFASLFNDSLIVRLPPDQREALSLAGGHPFEPMPGRPMKEYVAVPDRIIRSSGLIDWLARAKAYAETLPPKSKAGSSKRTRRS